MSRLLPISLATLLVAASTPTRVPRQPHRMLTILVVIDGLRPDAIDPRITPNLARLRSEGVEYRRSHSAFPTVTRVNAAVIHSGSWPAHTRIVSNGMFVPAVDSVRPFSTADPLEMAKLAAARGGRLIASRTLAERLQSAGKTYVSVGGGSGGNALLSSPTGVAGPGLLVHT